jgi:translocator protein
MKKFITFLVFIVIVLGLEIISSYFLKMPDSQLWYQTLVLPVSGYVENYLYAPIWAVMCLLVAFSGAFIWFKRKSNIGRHAFIFWAIQLGLNTIWPIILFLTKSPLLGAIDVSLVVIFTLLTINFSFQNCKIAGWLLSPYLIWTIFVAIYTWKVVVVL